MNVRVGQKAARELTVTAAMVEAYARITGDYNPLHFDPEFAARTRLRRLIAQGGIATGLLHALVAMDMPGPGTVFINQRWDFPKPVYIGDTIRAEATITSVRPDRPIATAEFTIVNQDGETVLHGEATMYQAEPREKNA